MIPLEIRLKSAEMDVTAKKCHRICVQSCLVGKREIIGAS